MHFNFSCNLQSRYIYLILLIYYVGMLPHLLFFYFMCLSVFLHVCKSVCICLVTRRPDHGTRFPRIGVTDGCWLPLWSWELNRGPLENSNALNHWTISPEIPLVSSLKYYSEIISYKDLRGGGERESGKTDCSLLFPRFNLCVCVYLSACLSICLSFFLFI